MVVNMNKIVVKNKKEAFVVKMYFIIHISNIIHMPCYNVVK